MKTNSSSATMQTVAGAIVPARSQDTREAHTAHVTPHIRRAARLPLRPLLLPHQYRDRIIALAAFYRETRTLGLAAGTLEGAARLDSWEAEVRRMEVGRMPMHPVIMPLAAAHLPMQPLLDLIEAQRMRAHAVSFATHVDLIRYCALAANPVGRLVLAMLGDDDYESAALSDALCSALLQTQLWRDIARDYVRGRVYVPQEDMRLFGVVEEELAEAVQQRQASTNLRALVAYEVERTQHLLAQGALVAQTLRHRARLDCGLLVADGQAMLAAIAKQGYDPFVARPTISKLDRGRAVLRTVRVHGVWRGYSH